MGLTPDSVTIDPGDKEGFHDFTKDFQAQEKQEDTPPILEPGRRTWKDIAKWLRQTKK